MQSRLARQNVFLPWCIPESLGPLCTSVRLWPCWSWTLSCKMLPHYLHCRDPTPQCWGPFRNLAIFHLGRAKSLLITISSSCERTSLLRVALRTKSGWSSRAAHGLWDFLETRRTVEMKMSLKSGWRPLLATIVHAALWGGSGVLSKKITVPSLQVTLMSSIRGSPLSTTDTQVFPYKFISVLQKDPNFTSPKIIH